MSTETGARDSAPRPRGVPPAALLAVLAVSLLAIGGVLVARWQREESWRAADAAAGREIATAAAVQAASATATAGAASAQATATIAAARAANPGMPEFTVERVEPNGSPLGEQVKDARRRYWQVYAEALETLDTTRLPEVATGTQLEHTISRVEELRTRGQILDVDIEHTVYVFNATETRAYLNDSLVDRSRLLDEVTRKPVQVTGQDPSIGVKREQIYVFERVDGIWKATNSFRVLNPGPVA